MYLDVMGIKQIITQLVPLWVFPPAKIKGCVVCAHGNEGRCDRVTVWITDVFLIGLDDSEALWHRYIRL